MYVNSSAMYLGPHSLVWFETDKDRQTDNRFNAQLKIFLS